MSEIKLQDKYNKLNVKYEKENKDLEQLKEINITKNNEYHQLNRIRRQQLLELHENSNNNSKCY
jgi:hypothetical protein